MNRDEITRIICENNYEVHFLQLGDADCILIAYKKAGSFCPKIIVVDAGNVGDSSEIKNFIINRWQTRTIDLAVCTHPDSDHKGGFFDLMDDEGLIIKEFWALDPYLYIHDWEYNRYYSESQRKRIARRAFDHPTDGRNLIQMAETKGIFHSPVVGEQFQDLPLWMVGPEQSYYHEVALGMSMDYKEIVDDPDTSLYDENAEVSTEEAKSVIDEDNETSPANQGSIILLMKIPDGHKFLFTGDCSCQALTVAYQKYGSELEGCILKVPHHGSKHNLTTALIDALKPVASAICAKGSRKHPNSGIVYWLSKYGNVYSTHKGEFFWSNNSKGKAAIPLKRRQF